MFLAMLHKYGYRWLTILSDRIDANSDPGLSFLSIGIDVSISAADMPRAVVRLIETRIDQLVRRYSAFNDQKTQSDYIPTRHSKIVQLGHQRPIAIATSNNEAELEKKTKLFFLFFSSWGKSVFCFRFRFILSRFGKWVLDFKKLF